MRPVAPGPMPLTAEVTPARGEPRPAGRRGPRGEVQRRMERRCGRSPARSACRGSAPARRRGRGHVHASAGRRSCRRCSGRPRRVVRGGPGARPGRSHRRPGPRRPRGPRRGDLTFNATVQLRPQATLGPYTGLEVGKAEPEMPEGALEAAARDRLRDQVARLDTGRAARGVRRLPDHRLRRRGRRRKGLRNATARDYLVELGGGRLVPGSTQPLVGAAPAGRPDVSAHLRRLGPAPRPAGTTVDYTVTVKARAGEGAPAARR